jgi:DNA-binding transcriptional ArsR family regulator
MKSRSKVIPLLGAPPADGAEPPLDRVFFALSDPIRRSILDRLEKGPKLVSELAEPFDISLQAVSRHIQVLVRAGLVHQERTGRIARCSLDVGPIFAAAVWINRYTKYWEAQFETLAAWLDAVDGDKEHEQDHD